MHWCRFALFLAASLALVTPVFTAPAFAQAAADSDRALALGHEGLDLYNKGNWAGARQKFAEADQLVHSPVFILYLARSARNAGDLIAAMAVYDRLASEVVPTGSPAPWTNAVESGKQERAELQKRIAEAAPPPSSGAVPGTSVPVAPVKTAPVASVAPRPTASIAGPLPEPSAGERLRPYAPALAAMGVGVIGFGVATGLFLHAKSMSEDVLSRCAGSVCNAADLPKKQMAVDFANGATIAGAISGAALAAGVVLVIVLDPARTAPAKGALKIEPGLGSIRVSGSF